MSTGYTTYQQHEPLRAPSGWSAQEKRFVAQLEELFDDIYKRYNRLRMEDMSPAFRKSFKQIMDDGAELRHDLDITAAGLSAEITRASTAEGNLSTSISATASGLSAEITRATNAEGNLSTSISATASGLSAEVTRATTAEGNLSTSISQTASAIRSEVSTTYLSKSDASSTYAKKSEIVQDDTSWKATFRKIGASGYTASGITTITENGITVTHSSLSNCKTEMSASGFRILNSSNTVIGGVMSLNNKIVTAMQCLYNPSYPNFRLEVGRFTNPLTSGTTLVDGIGFVYNNLQSLGIGKEFDAATGGFVAHSILSGGKFQVIADNNKIIITNGVFYLDIDPTDGISLRHTDGTGVYVTYQDVIVKYRKTFSTGLFTLRASNYFQPDD